MRILHLLDHTSPRHSAYALRAMAILRQQRAMGWHTIQLTGPRQGPVEPDRNRDGWHFFRTAPAASALHLPNSEFALRKARWDDSRAQKGALLDLLEAPPERERVRALVRQFTWDSVALQLADCYADAVARRVNGACAAPAAPGTPAHSVPR